MSDYRSGQWIRWDGRPIFRERDVFRFDRPNTARCDLCGDTGAFAMTLDLWAIGSNRKARGDRVLELTVCPPEGDAGRWSPDDWRWLISGAFRLHRGKTRRSSTRARP